MRGKLKVILTVLCLALLVCLFTACFGETEPQINGLEMYEGDKKIDDPVREYYYGDELTILNNLKLKVKYSDNSTKNLTLSDATLSVEYNSPEGGDPQILTELPKKGSPVGGYTINWKYKSLSVTITISILPSNAASGITYTLVLGSDTIMYSTQDMTYTVKGDNEDVEKDYIQELKFINKDEFDTIKKKEGNNAVKYCYENYEVGVQEWENIKFQPVGEYYAFTSVQNPLYATEYSDAVAFSVTPYLLTITQVPSASYVFQSMNPIKGISLGELSLRYNEVFTDGEYTAGEGVEEIAGVPVDQIDPYFTFVSVDTVVTGSDNGTEYEVVLTTDDGNFSSDVVTVPLMLEKGKLNPVLPNIQNDNLTYCGKEYTFSLTEDDLGLYTATGVDAATNAGNYELTVTMADEYAANYEWDYTNQYYGLEQYLYEHQEIEYKVDDKSSYKWIWKIKKADRNHVSIGEEGVYTKVETNSTFRPCRAGTNALGNYVDVKLVVNFSVTLGYGDTIDAAYDENDEFSMEVTAANAYIAKDDNTEAKYVKGIKADENVYLRLYNTDLTTGVYVFVTLRNEGNDNYNEFDFTQKIYLVRQDGFITTTNTGRMFVPYGTKLSEIPTPDTSLGTVKWYKDNGEGVDEEVNPEELTIDEICMLTMEFTAKEGMENSAQNGKYKYYTMPYMQDMITYNAFISWTDMGNGIVYEFTANNGEFKKENNGNAYQNKLVYIEETGLYDWLTITEKGGEYKHFRYVTPAYCSYLISDCFINDIDFIPVAAQMTAEDYVIKACIQIDGEEEIFGETWDRFLILDSNFNVTRYWTNYLCVYKKEQLTIEYNPEWTEEAMLTALEAADRQTEGWYVFFEVGDYRIEEQEESQE